MSLAALGQCLVVARVTPGVLVPGVSTLPVPRQTIRNLASDGSTRVTWTSALANMSESRDLRVCLDHNLFSTLPQFTSFTFHLTSREKFN